MGRRDEGPGLPVRDAESGPGGDSKGVDFVNDPKLPLSKRVGGQLSCLRAVLDAYNDASPPDRRVELADVPREADVVKRGVGAFLKWQEADTVHPGEGRPSMMSTATVRRKVTAALDACGMVTPAVRAAALEPGGRELIAHLPPWVARAGALSGSSVVLVWCEPRRGRRARRPARWC